MKNDKTRISANEINRFVYCPYQWYYNRYYGTKVLTEKYKALGITSEYEANLVKGLNHHKNYYLKYRIKRALQLGGVILIAIVILGVVLEWKL